jgi:hypothetical protein
MIINGKLEKMGEEERFRTKAQKDFSVPFKRYESTIAEYAESVICKVLRRRRRRREEKEEKKKKKKKKEEEETTRLRQSIQ